MVVAVSGSRRSEWEILIQVRAPCDFVESEKSSTDIKAGGVVGAKYRATRAPCGLCDFSSWSDERGLSEYTRFVRSVSREDRPPQWGIVHEHTRRPDGQRRCSHTHTQNRIFTGRPGHMKTGHPHLSSTLTMVMHQTANPPMPCLWRAPASAHNPPPKGKSGRGHSPERAVEGLPKPKQHTPALVEKGRSMAGRHSTANPSFLCS